MIKATDDGLKQGAEVLTADSQMAKKKCLTASATSTSAP